MVRLAMEQPMQEGRAPRLAGEPPDIAIDPHIGHIGLAEFDRAAEMIDAGAAAVEDKLPQIRDALSVLSGPYLRNGVH